MPHKSRQASNLNNARTCSVSSYCSNKPKRGSMMNVAEAGSPVFTYAERRHCYTITSLQPPFFLYLLYIPSVIRFRFNGRRSLLQSALRRFILPLLIHFWYRRGNGNRKCHSLILTITLLQLSTIVVVLCTWNKEINKNSPPKALPFSRHAASPCWRLTSRWRRRRRKKDGCHLRVQTNLLVLNIWFSFLNCKYDKDWL